LLFLTVSLLSMQHSTADAAFFMPAARVKTGLYADESRLQNAA